MATSMLFLFTKGYSVKTISNLIKPLKTVVFKMLLAFLLFIF